MLAADYPTVRITEERIKQQPEQEARRLHGSWTRAGACRVNSYGSLKLDWQDARHGRTRSRRRPAS